MLIDRFPSIGIDNRWWWIITNIFVIDYQHQSINWYQLLSIAIDYRFHRLFRSCSSPRKQIWNGIRSQISPSAERLDKFILSKMPWVNFSPFLYLKIHSLISSNSMNPFFRRSGSSGNLKWEKFSPIFVQITFLCTFRNTYNRQQNCLDTDLKWGTSISGKETNFTLLPPPFCFFTQVAIMYKGAKFLRGDRERHSFREKCVN